MKIKLYHYSNKDLKIISPDFFGENSYTAREKRISPLPRIFFYLEPKPEEYHLENTKYLYTSIIDKADLYDLQADKDNLKEKFISLEDLLTYLKDNYKGVIYNLGYGIACLFYSITPINKIDLFINPKKEGGKNGQHELL